MADPTQTNDQTDNVVPNNDASAAPVDTSSATSSEDIADKVAPKGTAYHSAVSNGAIAPTIVEPGSIYNGIRVPSGAKSVAGGNWLNPAGQIMADEPINPDGSVNKHSSAYTSELQQSMLDAGVNPIIIDKMMKPIWDGAKATQDMINTNSDKFLAQIKANQDIKANQQAIQSNQAALNKTYQDGIAEAFASGGPTAAKQVLGQYISMIDSTDSTGKLVKQYFPQMDGTPQGLDSTIKTAVSQGAAAAQQTQATLEATRTGKTATAQGTSTSQITNETQLNGAYTEENSNYNTISQNNEKLLQAKKYIDNAISKGGKGGGLANRWQDFLNEFGVGTPEYATVQSVLAANAPPQIRQAIGAGNRMGQTEFTNMASKLSDGSMPLQTLSTILGNSVNYNSQQAQISDNKLHSYEFIAKQHGIQLAPRTNAPAATAIAPGDDGSDSGKIFKMIAPSGHIVSIPESKVKEALQRGAKMVPNQ